MKIGSRIRKLRKAKEMTILELANAINSDVGNISRLERNKQGYTDSTISKIAEALEVKMADLFIEGDENDVLISANPSRKRKYFKVQSLNVEASAGYGISTGEFVETIGSIEYTTEEARLIFGNRHEDFVKVIAVKGDSMSGTIESGDQIFVDIAVNQFDGDGIYVFSFGRAIHVKRLQIQKNRLAVLSDNPNYETWYIEESEEPQLYIQGKVIVSHSHVYRRHG
ncbi:XRE family transcriptional regulator [Xenorhabdus bovienii]|uniref:XRE family transcriptional regulator n=1 Tax=Xenorhabdus bovienii TaxID=40576 RepID=UPI0004DACC3A|nr:S24 family peptidase [Xenorhabdus bovienii]CDG90108.1 putative transcriptional regulator [Xenorhabdus bovienii str. feltiae France]CDG91684.1 putative transcriptional regulator [Xenorhabdus bovienii str. feltiae Florida]